MKFKLIGFGLLFFQLALGQMKNDSTALNLHFKFGKQEVKLNEKYVSSNNDTLQIETLRFYISKIKIEYADQSTFLQPNSYHLVDIEDSTSYRIPICQYNNKKISKIIFNIGVDSIMSVSGALKGDLDPTKGMYWAWQSGYINMKIEGKCNRCKTRKNQFFFHLGGYMKPNNALREIALEINQTQPDINIDIDLEAFFSKIRLAETNNIMIPGKKAMELADYGVLLFKIE